MLYKALVFDLSVDGIASSNPADSTDVRLFYLSFVVQAAASARIRSLVQRNPIECVCVCVCRLIVCDLETSTMGRARRQLGCCEKIRIDMTLT